MMSRTAPADPVPQIKSNTGLRGIAALLVVAYHLQLAGYPMPFESIRGVFDRGYLMVDLFFVLSGFILTYVSKPDGSLDYPRYTSFMIGRFIRIYPLHIFCLGSVVLIAAGADGLLHHLGYRTVFGDWSADGLKLLVAQATLTNGWFFTRSGWNTPTWSISVEIVAYAIFPIVVVLLRRWRTTSVVLLVLSVSFYVVVAVVLGSLDIIGRIAILRCLAGFVLGMVICDNRAYVRSIGGYLLSAVQIGIVTALILMLCSPVNDCLVVPLFAALVFTTSDDRGILGNILGLNPLQFLGRISYSIYLNHVCLLIIVLPLWSRFSAALEFDGRWILPIFFTLVIVISTITYRYIELPLGRLLSSKLRFRNDRHLSATPSAP